MSDNKKIFIGGLNYSTTEKILLSELEKFGRVLSCRIIVDRDSGKSKGYGFATFSNRYEALAAIEGLNNQMLDGRRVGVKESIEKNRQ
jgi:RNA recognition motif-containing protein